MLSLQFLGGVGTVTGSKYLVEGAAGKVLVDCGLFQGYKQLRLRNWRALPTDVGAIDAVLLTHAHLDHSGYLPRLVKAGYDGPVYATRATQSLCSILLPDSGYLHEKEADFANRHGFSKHKPALPLYTKEDAEDCLGLIQGIAFGEQIGIAGFDAIFYPAGHILGASMIRLETDTTSILFSGDLGRYGMATMVDPTGGLSADYLVVESTYGNRVHGDEDPAEILADTIVETIARGGTVLIPSFAVGRTQILLFYLEQLKRTKRIPDIPIYVDSPMAIDASEIFMAHPEAHRLTPEQVHRIFSVATYVREVEDSKSLDHNGAPKVLISASGMATGGRILHHLKVFGPDPRATILFVGFQAGGTRGAAMLAGERHIKVHGDYVPIRAAVRSIDTLSAHADQEGLMRWLRSLAAEPKHTFITHGEPDSADRLRRLIEEQLGWSCSVPDYLERVGLDGADYG